MCYVLKNRSVIQLSGQLPELYGKAAEGNHQATIIRIIVALLVEPQVAPEDTYAYHSTSDYLVRFR